jgi:hypothetical protein
MGNIWLRFLVAVISAAGLTRAVAADNDVSFSADLVRVATDGHSDTIVGRLNVGDRWMRIATPEVATGFFIVATDASAAYYVKAEQRVFMDAKQSSRLAQIFIPLDPENPCQQWLAMAKLAGVEIGERWRCERISEGPDDGPSTFLYRLNSSPNEGYRIWINRNLKFPKRIRSDDGTTMEIMNVEIAPQPASLFEVPADYMKFDPLRLIDRLKQSDVWVEPVR